MVNHRWEFITQSERRSLVSSRYLTEVRNSLPPRECPTNFSLSLLDLDDKLKLVGHALRRMLEVEAHPETYLARAQGAGGYKEGIEEGLALLSGRVGS